MKDDRLVLFVDIDDVLVFSSPLIQKEVNEKTIFKTFKLQIIEQLMRNCAYYRTLVQAECLKAFDEERLPDLSRFPNMEEFSFRGNFDFDSLTNEEVEQIYLAPIAKAHEYEKMTKRIYDHFLEARDMFLEGDNLSCGEAKEYNFPEEEKHIMEFKRDLFSIMEELANVNEFCYQEIVRIIEEAKKDFSKPNYGSLVKMDSNDIIRTNSGSDDYYYLFDKPLQDVNMTRGTTFFRDLMQDLEIRRNPSREAVDYDSIYTLEHTDLNAVGMIKKAMRTGKISELVIISHHNGDREEKAKRKLMQFLFPEAKFIGLRFHNTEHNVERRARSSKFDVARMFYPDIDPSHMVLLDDSKDNCRDWKENGGEVIYYRKITEAEKATQLEDSAFRRMIDFGLLIQFILGIHALVNAKEKIKMLRR